MYSLYYIVIIRIFLSTLIHYHFRVMSYVHLWKLTVQARCTRCNIMCKELTAGLLFSPGTPVSFTNKTDRDDITEILLKVALSTMITHTLFVNFI